MAKHTPDYFADVDETAEVAQTDLSGPSYETPWGAYDYVPPPDVTDPTTKKALVYQARIVKVNEVATDRDGWVFGNYRIQLLNAADGRDNFIGFARISTRPRQSGRMVGTSQASDLLLGCESPERPASKEDWEETLAELAGAAFETTLSWEAYDKDSGRTVAYDPPRKSNPELVFPDDPERPGYKLPYVEIDGRRIVARASLGFIRTPRT